MNSKLILKEFIDSNVLFKLIYKTNVMNNQLLVKNILILDSSFNPPHKAHLSLINNSINYYNTKIHKEKIENEVLLLFSTNNADKKFDNTIEDFSNRLNMVKLFADYINVYSGNNVRIGLTKNAKFINKYNSIKEEFSSLKTDINKFIFLMGFDTLIRVFDSKYYKPLTVEESLDEFIRNSRLFVLTRKMNENDRDSYGLQTGYLDRISRTEKIIPIDWLSHIDLIENSEKEMTSVSSSDIRKRIGLNEDDWQFHVVDSIRDYIIERGLYRGR
ncbi:nicotinamide-nucleotide adenylyltransferase [Ascoidea rubescens DSM 1968]|uniref:Nicotinate-nucleotide adenylyltransferase n=1 Tax=Ascoidea rubescens DSM 1968 TaxID=1344418 RepID=A0A1D2VLL6_9ASCO|nr:nicotinate-nucleotide adenylyltransferase [Ascoidea rubescens DSM 1968]ODV62492.1 nicotinate-nucleotide adenylyltransferase [Ascoidea rubescens DSM 1968]